MKTLVVLLLIFGLVAAASARYVWVEDEVEDQVQEKREQESFSLQELLREFVGLHAEKRECAALGETCKAWFNGDIFTDRECCAGEGTCQMYSSNAAWTKRKCQ